MGVQKSRVVSTSYAGKCSDPEFGPEVMLDKLLHSEACQNRNGYIQWRMARLRHPPTTQYCDRNWLKWGVHDESSAKGLVYTCASSVVCKGRAIEYKGPRADGLLIIR